MSTSIRWRDTKKVFCKCDADATQVSQVIESYRGEITRLGVQGMRLKFMRKRAQMVRHYRARDEAHFWHWSDVKAKEV